jgi:hypothetical protein
MIQTKGKKSVKRASMFIVLLIEVCNGEAELSRLSSNTSNVKGIRVERDDGSKEIWTMTAASFEESKIQFLLAILCRIDNDFASHIIPILKSENAQSILKGLDEIVTINVAVKSSYFILKLGDVTTPSASTSLSLVYQAYSEEDEIVGDPRAISWECSADQKDCIRRLMMTLGDNGLKGSVVDSCSLDYALQMCIVLDTCLDPYKLQARIDQINGVRAENDTEEEGDSADLEAQEDGGRDPITPFELSRLFFEEIDGESEPVRYDFGQKTQNPKKSTRVKNGLASLVQVCKILSPGYNWLKPFGEHFDCRYVKFLATKLSIELKSFISNGNSPYWYKIELSSNNTSFAGKRFGQKEGPTDANVFKHIGYRFPLYLPSETTTPLDQKGNPLWAKASRVDDRDLCLYMKATNKGCKKSLTLSGIVRKMINGGSLKILYETPITQTFVTFKPNSIYPCSRYIMNSGEIVLRHGKFYINIKLQERNIYAGMSLLFNIGF